jgi:hypothetical protein
MNFLLPIYIWPIFRLLTRPWWDPQKQTAAAEQVQGNHLLWRNLLRKRVADLGDDWQSTKKKLHRVFYDVVVYRDRASNIYYENPGFVNLDEEAINTPFCALQEKFHTFVLRGLRNISEAR